MANADVQQDVVYLAEATMGITSKSQVPEGGNFEEWLHLASVFGPLLSIILDPVAVEFI